MAKDPIDEFIALPTEKQMATLKMLDPAKQDKLLGAVKTRRAEAAFTANAGGEGLYQMVDKSGKSKGIPYSRVNDAYQLGYRMTDPKVIRDYAKHTAADPNINTQPEGGPSRVVGRNANGQPILQPAETKPEGSAASRFLSSAGGAIGGAASGLYHAVIEGPQNPEEAKIEAASVFGPVDLRIQRMLIAPAAAEAQKARTEFQEANKLTPASKFKPSAQAAEHRQLALGHALAAAVPGVGPWAAQFAEQAGTQVGQGDIAGAVGTAAGNAALYAIPHAARGAGALKNAAVERFARAYGPREITVAGEKVPVLVGEANPTSRAGRTQINVKRSGTGAAKFDAVSRQQQSAVKNVIRRVAQQTSGMTGPMAAEPGAAMADAAETTFAKARPMYTALDASLKTVPDALEGVSKVLSDAIGRAKKLGVELGDANVDLSKIRPDKDGSIQWGGSRISQTTHPERWNALVKEGIIDETGHGTPLSAYMKVRSQLLKMQRSSTDPAMRNAIGNEVRAMNEHMETALKGTPLYENWTEANRLWSKAYALRDVADAITKATRGTPAAEQAAGMEPVETRVQGASLVNRLNTLKEDGILDRALSPAEASNLRQAADILDRSRTAAGKDSSFMHGYSPRSVIWRALIKLPALPLVNAMTSVDGLKALKAAEAAKTPMETTAAIARIAAIAGTSAAPKKVPGSRKEAIETLNAPETKP